MTKLEDHSDDLASSMAEVEETRRAVCRERKEVRAERRQAHRAVRAEEGHPHRDAIKEKTQEVKEKTQEEKTVRGRPMPLADILKFAGLIAFILLMLLVCFLAWPYIHDIFEPGGIDRVMHDVREAGAVGFFILLGIQLLQVIVAFIPGEVVQVAAGMIYGPWLGALVVLIGCVISSAVVFVLVHKLGAPFVQAMVPAKYMEKFRKFENSGRLNIVVFVLFLIPGMPKDVFTYITPLTHMPLRTFLLLTNLARIPGIVVSTYAASGLVNGDIAKSVIIFLVAGAIAVAGIFGYNRIMKALEKMTGRTDLELRDFEEDEGERIARAREEKQAERSSDPDLPKGKAAGSLPR